MRVEFAQPDDDQRTTVATAEWDGREVTVASEDDGHRDALAKAFRRTPIVIDDASYRRLGTSGLVVLPPGGLGWFRAVAQVRVPAETGLVARFVPGAIVGGFDPAAGYRTFEEQVERLDERSRT
jgi:hypothetical protein